MSGRSERARQSYRQVLRLAPNGARNARRGAKFEFRQLFHNLLLLLTKCVANETLEAFLPLFVRRLKSSSELWSSRNATKRETTRLNETGRVAAQRHESFPSKRATQTHTHTHKRRGGGDKAPEAAAAAKSLSKLTVKLVYYSEGHDERTNEQVGDGERQEKVVCRRLEAALADYGHADEHVASCAEQH